MKLNIYKIIEYNFLLRANVLSMFVSFYAACQYRFVREVMQLGQSQCFSIPIVHIVFYGHYV
jgi:hypothetical protein